MDREPKDLLLLQSLRTALSVVEHSADTIEKSATLCELRRALHATIAELEITARPCRQQSQKQVAPDDLASNLALSLDN